MTLTSWPSPCKARIVFVLLASAVTTLSPPASWEAIGADVELIRGRVVDQQGDPIAAAKLWYEYAFSMHTSERLAVSARSDAEGRFTLEVPVRTEEDGFTEMKSDVWAFSRRYCLGTGSPRSAQAKQGPDGLRIELNPATDTSLRVLDPDGLPVPGVIVEPANYRATRGFDLVPDGAKPLVGARTDASGRVKLPALARDHLFSVWVTTEAYGVQTQRFIVQADQPAEQTIRLRPTCGIEGRVIAEKPEWARGIRLVFTTEEKLIAGGRRPPWPTEGRGDATTDENGRFEIPVIAAGRLSMIDTVIDERLPVRPQLPQRFELPAGETTVVELQMRQLVDIRGSIVAKDTREPLPGIEVHISYGGFWQGTNAVSDAKGQFSARVLPGQVRFQPMNLSQTNYLHLGARRPHNVPQDAVSVVLRPIEVVPCKPLGGRLVDQDDLPVDDAQVFAIYGNRVCSWATSGKDGRFELPKIPLSVEPDKATYRVVLGIGETRYMGDGGVEILQSDPFALRVKR